jgi:putative membrane protein
MILDVAFFLLAGISVGVVSGFMPGISSENIAMLIVSSGIVPQGYMLASTLVSLGISSSFFEFLSPMMFGIGNDETSLLIPQGAHDETQENFVRGINLVVMGGLLGIALAFPMAIFAGSFFPLVFGSLQPLAKWILLSVCVYMVWMERGMLKKAMACLVFIISGVLGVVLLDSGLVNPDLTMLPIFAGLYGIAGIVFEHFERAPGEKSAEVEALEFIGDIGWKEKAGIAWNALTSSLFAIVIPGMKRGQASAIAMRGSSRGGKEERLFLLPMVSCAFVMFSIFALSSAGKARGHMALEISEAMGGEVAQYNVLLFAGAVAVSACVSACVMMVLARPIGKMLVHKEGLHLRAVGLVACLIIVAYFTGIWGIAVAATCTCIGLLQKLLKVRSVHLMGVLLLPSLLALVL